MSNNLNVLYSDNHIIVCFKEKGILSQSDGSETLDMLTLVKEYIKEKYNKPGEVFLGLVHRLDRNTSGVMVFARTSKAAKRLTESIQNDLFHKKYYAICEGIFKDKNGDLSLNISKDTNKQIAYYDPSGKLAKLNYSVLKEGKINNQDVSLLDIKLYTGRFHQIRFQMAYLNHPLYGDKKYGSKNDNNYNMPLVAYSLSFPHPITKEIMTFEAEVLNSLKEMI